MKKIVLFCAILIGAYSTSNAQFGVKAGLNFNSNGDLTHVITETATNVQNSSNKTGYHFGVFYQTKGDSFYVRPELVYTKTKSDYDGADFDMSKIDAPILLGYHIFKPLSIFAGPSLQYILNTELSGVEFDAVKNDFTVGLNIGAAVQFDSFGIDVRYEKGLSENLADKAGINPSRLDTRPNQFIISLSLKL